MDEVKLSIIVPVYNAEEYLERCIESILGQRYKNFELIIVNDGSTDGSSLIIDRFKEKDDRIISVSQKNMGSIKARLSGIEKSHGEYITFVDSDDWIDEDLYELMMGDAINHEADIVAVGYTEIKNIISVKKRNEYPDGVYKNDSLMELKEKVLYYDNFYKSGIMPSLCSKLFRRSVIMSQIQKPPFDIRMGEDSSISYPAIAKARVIVVNNNICGYNYQIIESSMSHAYDEKYFGRAKSLFDYLEANLSSCEEMRKKLVYYKLFILQLGIESLVSPKNNKVGFVKKINLLNQILCGIEELGMISYNEINWDGFSNIDKRKINALMKKKGYHCVLYYYIGKIISLYKRN